MALGWQLPGGSVLLGGDLTGTSNAATVAAIGNATVVSTLAELDAIAPAVGGVRTINQQIYLIGFVFIPNGERIEVGVTNAIVGHGTFQCGFIGNVGARKTLLTGGLLQFEWRNSRVVASPSIASP